MGEFTEKLEKVFMLVNNTCPGTNLSHLRVFMAVAKQEGITMPELLKSLEMSQASVSRIVKDLSSYRTADSGSSDSSHTKGHNILLVSPDAYHRKRLAVFLTEKGKKLKEEIEEALSK